MSESLSLQEIERRLFDLLASTFLEFVELDEWQFEDRGVKLPFFKNLDGPRELSFEKSVNLGEGEGRWVLRVDITGNGELYVDGSLYQAVDEYHRISVLPPGNHHLKVSATPRRLFGENPWSLGFLGACVSRVMWDEFTQTLQVIDLLSLARNNKEVREALARGASRVEVTPSVAQVYALSRTLYGSWLRESNPEFRGLRWDYAYIASVYGPAVERGLMEDTPQPSPEAVKKSVKEVLGEIKHLFSEGRREGKVYLFGHAHIDTAWLWPFSETRLKVRRTFSTVARLADMGYRFTFAQSGAQNYEWLEKEDPELFEKIKRLVEDGRWLPVGGMWVESDTQLLTGESLARQLLYGQRYFQEKLGRKSRIGWLPDSFGFSAQLPQLLRKAGIEVFVTHKVMWNDTNEFPFHAFRWRALDGSEVVAHVLVQTYNGTLTAEEISSLWARYKQKDVLPAAVHAYGFGDGGGGPTFTMLERAKLLKKLGFLPELVEAPTEEEYVSALVNAREKLPVWEGEIYNEFHRGVYTTNLKVKELMSRAESEARWAEWSSTVSSLLGSTSYPASDLREAWKRILRCQFHDVLPGSSSFEAYLEAYRDLEEAISALQEVSSRALDTIAQRVDAPKGSVVVFNSLPWPVRLPVRLPGRAYRYPDGRPVEAQESGKEVIALVEVPASGYVALLPSERDGEAKGVEARYEEGGLVLENEFLRVKIGSDGKLLSVYDKEQGFEFLANPSNVLRAHPDKPGNFDAWDIDRSALESGYDFEIADTPKITVSGPIASSAEYSLRFKGSEARVRVTLYKGSRLIEFHVSFDWREKCYLVKTWFNFSVKSEAAHFEVPFGVVERRTQPRYRWDEARYEVPALRWMDLSDGMHGVAVIVTTRHGYSLNESSVGLSLLKSPLMPNPWSDLGKSETTYYLYPHPGDYRAGKVYERAYEAWAGIRAVEKRTVGGDMPASSSFLEAEPGIIVEAVKMGEEEGIILRLYEVEGRRREATLRLPRNFKVYEVNLLEEDPSFVAEGASVKLDFKSFEVKTLLLRAR